MFMATVFTVLAIAVAFALAIPVLTPRRSQIALSVTQLLHQENTFKEDRGRTGECIDVISNDLPISVTISNTEDLPYYYKLAEYTTDCATQESTFSQPEKSRKFPEIGTLRVNERKVIQSFRMVDSPIHSVNAVFTAPNGNVLVIKNISSDSCNVNFASPAAWAKYATSVKIFAYGNDTVSTLPLNIYEDENCGVKVGGEIYSGTDLVAATLRNEKRVKSFRINLV